MRLGNALADIAAMLAAAQEKTESIWMLELPATSLMWLYGAVAELLNKATTYLAVVDVCMFGAPWRKPTSLESIFAGVLRLFLAM